MWHAIPWHWSVARQPMTRKGWDQNISKILPLSLLCMHARFNLHGAHGTKSWLSGDFNKMDEQDCFRKIADIQNLSGSKQKYYKIFIDLIRFTFATCRSSPKLTDYSFCVVCSYQYGLISTLISECSAVACSGMDVDWYNEARTLLLVFIFIWSFFSSWAPLHKCNDSGDVWWSTRCNTSGPGRLKKNVGSAKSLTWKPCVPASRRTETYQKWFVVRGDQLLGWEISDIRYKQHPFESQIFPVILLLCGTGCLFAPLHTITVMRKVKQKRSN